MQAEHLAVKPIPALVPACFPGALCAFSARGPYFAYQYAVGTWEFTHLTAALMVSLLIQLPKVTPRFKEQFVR